MKPSRRASLLSAFCATFFVGLFALKVTTWTDRWVLFFLIFWFLSVIAFFRGFMRLEMLWFMDRDWTAKRAGKPTPFVSHDEFMQSALRHPDKRG